MLATARAQRWAIERAFRPAVDGIEWLGYAKPVLREATCLACGLWVSMQGVLRARGRTLHACPACASHQYDAPPPVRPSEAAEPAPAAIRHALEYGADLMADAAWLAPVLDEQAGSLLIAHCGLGFGVALARASGWAAFGYDPSPWAAAGRAAFGPVVQRRADPDPVGPARFAALLGDRAIGTSDNPAAAAAALGDRLIAGGPLRLREADVGRLYDADIPAAIHAAADPDRAMLLPSDLGLSRLCARSGLGEVAVSADAGGLIASRGPDRPMTAAALLELYLLDAPERPEPGLTAGLAVRAFERAVNAGDWPWARAVAEGLRPVLRGVATLSALQGHDGSLDGLFAQLPLGAARVSYHAAMLALNGDDDPAAARAGFLATAALARAAYLADPALMAPEADRVWAARFHAAYAARRLDEHDGGLLESLAAGQDDPPLPPPSAMWRARAAELLATARAAPAAPRAPVPTRRGRRA